MIQALEGRQLLSTAEFLGTDQSPRGQQLMLQYLDDIDSVGELPLYHGDTYDRALEAGTVPALGAEVMVK